MAHSLAGRRILLCVCGGIAAYKSVELVRRLREAGAEVQVAMTENAQRFIGAASLQAVSGVPVRGSLWDEAAEAAMGHIELARWADAVLVAPATADVLARLAHGMADDLVTTLCLATTAPLFVAPAMNNRMWLHPATLANLATLRARGVSVIGPESGSQACGEIGPGRLSEPPAIVEVLAASLSSGPDLAGCRILISAGPTYEDLDPVRFIGNRSSGKMGFAIAASAARRGAQVVLVAGPVSMPTPPGVRRINVRSAAEMHDAVLGSLPADVYIGAAAVADYTAREIQSQKIKKSDQPDGGDTLTIELVRTRDVLAEVAAHAQRPRVVVGFAAETHDVEHYARDKLVRKQLDMIAANQVGCAGSGFESDDNALTVIDAERVHSLGSAPKTVLADALLDLIRARL
ncbi:bifunctional phosphopantothenoylcysteine decarboxylase/phosphopantothenate--cysteine ligase CoaBC [Lysobacter brunescens]|uniref:Coenzyme A biosynthesis bifunctional protein CoaBC n=1 Tax=Lysobacter brunescens TaxID=262323 RepID=A0ABW2Y984_9GAMM